MPGFYFCRQMKKTDQSIANLKAKEFLLEYLAETLLLGFLVLYYSFGFYYGSLLQTETKYTLLVIYILYVGFILPIHVFKNKLSPVYNSLLIFRLAFRFVALALSTSSKVQLHTFFKNKTEKYRFLFFLVKIIFIPIMLNFFIEYVVYMYAYFTQNAFSIAQLSSNFQWFLVLSALIFGIDTLYFSFGYLVESKKLGSKLRSVDTSVLGWVVALACYKPFNNVTVRLFPMLADEKIFWINEQWTSVIYIAVLFFYLVYLLATFALGAKCSNLTNRGIVHRGIYSVIRHPAYSGKLIAWWLLCIPIMNPKVFISMAAWTVLYLLRAYTEEQHLLKDADYVAYCQKVKWRFIPYLY
jgi:protein-S-isoprenylcysteine O-methyltransferase Ste14